MTNLASAPQVKAQLARYGIHAKKRLGQNFLIDRNVLDRLLNVADVRVDSNVIEIGPGLGVVTLELAKRAGKVVCVEVDRDLEPILRETLSDCPNIETVIEDFLKLDLAEFLGGRSETKWTVIANLPYYITTPILTRLIDTKQCLDAILLMVQREVARRLLADAGSEDYGSISVFVRYHCAIQTVMRVSRNVFYPIPDVDSELVKLTVREAPAVVVADEALFFAIVRAAFGKRRKTLLNALSSSANLAWSKPRAEAVLSAAGIDPGRRGETLSLEEFAALANNADLTRDQPHG
jgi:16S rRNA (adenine1518-N6/adenine1519-N6)-dimethyltransferase